MRQDRLEVLKMLAEGKINAEEAELLLRALDDDAAPDTKTDPNPEKSKQGKDFFQEVTEIFQDVGREIEREVTKAVESVQRSDVKKVVNDVVDQVKSSVSETVDVVSDTADSSEDRGEKRRVKQQLEVFRGNGIATIDAQTANGQITLEGSNRDGVIVRARKEIRGRQSTAAEFAEKIEVYAEKTGDTLRVFAHHPPPPKGVNVAIRYAIETPREVDVNLRTVNSKIKVTGIHGAIDATTTNGGIKLNGETGPIRARATNGSIKADIDRLTQDAAFSTTNGSIAVTVNRGTAPVAALTTNGSINLTLPADFDGQLDAEATRGRVHSDFPVPVVGKIKNQCKGEIGRGGEAVIKLRSRNGSIRLKRQEP